jgi:hypothetical protein
MAPVRRPIALRSTSVSLFAFASCAALAVACSGSSSSSGADGAAGFGGASAGGSVHGGAAQGGASQGGAHAGGAGLGGAHAGGAAQGGSSAGGAAQGGSSAGGAGLGGAHAGGAGQGGACAPVVAAADVDPWVMRAPSAGFGGIEQQKNGPHTDVFLKSPAGGGQAAGYVKVGARLDWGGTLVFYGLGADPASNVLDANDTGRELQIALYDPTRSRQPCAADASCQQSNASCGNSITFLGWDPVQGGDECGHGATVLSSGQSGDGLRLVVQPLQWNPDWDAPSCAQSACGASGRPVDVTFILDLRFVSTHVLEIATEVSSIEAIDHPVTGQEFPTLYVAHGQNGPDLPDLLDASGQPVALVNPGNDGFYYGNFDSPGPWVSWQNAQHAYGVAIGMDQGITKWQGWRGDGNTAPYFHNVRAQIAFGLGSGKAVRGISYLALGSFATVQQSLAEVLAKRPPFGVVDAPPAAVTTTYAPGAPIHVAGWALDTAHVASVRVEIDGALAATLPVGDARPDVCEVYPAYAGCPGVGYSGDVPTTNLSACPHLLRVIAIDADGNATTIGERAVAPS